MYTTISVSIIYGVTAVLSLLLAVGYCVMIKKKENWLIWLYFSVFIANLGYFTLSISKTVEEALLANRLAYLGCVFLPLFMMMTILKVCKVKCGPVATGIMIVFSCIVFFIVASQGYTDWYYREVELEVVNGTAKLVKVYGLLHNLYYIYLFTYLIGIIGAILYSTFQKRMKSAKHAVLLVVVVVLNVCIWFIEQFINWDFEFLSISYIASEVLMLLLYGMIQDYETEATEVVTSQMMRTEQIDYEGIDILSAREKEVLKGMLEDKKRREIAEELCITENTVKKHVSNIFAKLNVTNRNELYEKLINK